MQVNDSTNGLRNVWGARAPRPLCHGSRDTVSRPESAVLTDVFGGRHKQRARRALRKRGRVILWDDTFVRYHEPHIGIAAVKVLEALGFEVSLVKNRRCCGRPAFSQGNLDAAAKLAKHNISQLTRPP